MTTSRDPYVFSIQHALASNTFLSTVTIQVAIMSLWNSQHQSQSRKLNSNGAPVTTEKVNNVYLTTPTFILANLLGRHTLVVPSDHVEQGLPAPTNSAHAITKGILRMFTSFPWWDVSFLVAFFFSVGCALFIMSGLFFWLPLVVPSSDFPHESATAGGVTSFVGGTLFEFGAVLLLFEAINENQTGCFGWELEGVFSNHEKSGEGTLRYKPEKKTCDHQHCKLNGYGFMKGAPGSKFSRRKWEWWPTWHELVEPTTSMSWDSWAP